MKTILIAYIILINLVGFFAMMIDKRRAIRRSWRIPEKKLFLIALLFGSVGMLIGMYFFHHKTKHLTFAIGIPAILVLQLLVLSFLFTWNQERMASPSQAVQHELELIRDLDSDTIQSYVSYENLTNSYLESGDLGEETTEAVSLFFENFEYNIHSETIEGDLASVTVSITNLDMKALARDLCTSILKNSVELYPESYTSTTSDYYLLLRDTIKNGSYDHTVTTATFHLQKDEAGWVILVDSTLEDELVSGFLSYMNDPYLLSASEVLAIQMDALKALDAQQWIDYLELEDIFATYNSDYYPLIDTAYAEQLAAHFDYEILKCSEEGEQAHAVLRIHSVDMTTVLAIYKELLLGYAATTQSIRDDAVSFSNETARLLLQALESNTEGTASDLNLTLKNNGSTWDIFFDDAFTDAIMGGMTDALNAFNGISTEPEAESISVS